MGDAADDAYDAAMWEDDEPAICSTCPDGVPAIMPPEGWTCPECDAEWGDDEPAAPDATSTDPQPGTQDRNAGRSETQSGSGNEEVRG